MEQAHAQSFQIASFRSTKEMWDLGMARYSSFSWSKSLVDLRTNTFAKTGNICPFSVIPPLSSKSTARVRCGCSSLVASTHELFLAPLQHHQECKWSPRQYSLLEKTPPSQTCVTFTWSHTLGVGGWASGFSTNQFTRRCNLESCAQIKWHQRVTSLSIYVCHLAPPFALTSK